MEMGGSTPGVGGLGGRGEDGLGGIDWGGLGGRGEGGGFGGEGWVLGAQIGREKPGGLLGRRRGLPAANQQAIGAEKLMGLPSIWQRQPSTPVEPIYFYLADQKDMPFAMEWIK